MTARERCVVGMCGMIHYGLLQRDLRIRGGVSGQARGLELIVGALTADADARSLR